MTKGEPVDLAAECRVLAAAIRATFERRQTPIPAALPTALTGEFGHDREKSAQWRAFLSRTGLEDAPAELAEVVEHLNGFLALPLQVAASCAPANYVWSKAGPWRDIS